MTKNIREFCQWTRTSWGKTIVLVITVLCTLALTGQKQMTEILISRLTPVTPQNDTMPITTKILPPRPVLVRAVSTQGPATVTGPTKLSVAIIVPYRDRAIHLKIFINYMTTFLKNQHTQATIFVVEQGEGRFNRAKLFNVGYVEAMRDGPYNCFIFHDVDLIPEDPHNIYTCGKHPIHMSAAVDKFGYKLPYDNIFGGVVSMTDEHMQRVNGFSNVYWGWGGEDDDMHRRLSAVGEKRARKSMLISRYTMLQKTGKHSSAKPLANRLALLDKAVKRMKTDGISSLDYQLRTKENRGMYKWLLVDLHCPSTYLVISPTSFPRSTTTPKSQKKVSMRPTKSPAKARTYLKKVPQPKPIKARKNKTALNTSKRKTKKNQYFELS